MIALLIHLDRIQHQQLIDVLNETVRAIATVKHKIAYMYNGVDDVNTDVDTLDDALFDIDYVQRRIYYMYKDKYDE